MCLRILAARIPFLQEPTADGDRTYTDDTAGYDKSGRPYRTD